MKLLRLFPSPIIITFLLMKIQQIRSGPYLDYCSKIPYNPITKCNITCDTCSSSQNLCSTCPSYLTLNGSECFSPINQRVTYNQYFYDTNLKTNTNLNNFNTENGMLTTDDVFRLCIANNYKFDIIGLFSNQDQLSFTESYVYQSSTISLNFRLFYTTQIVLLKIFINQRIAYNLSLDSGFVLDINITGTPQQDSSGTKWNIGRIDTDPTPYLSQIFAPIKTGMLPLSSKSANIKISVESSSSTNVTQKFWGINDLSVVAVRCNNCIVDTLIKFGRVLGIVIGISFGAMVFLLLVVTLHSRIKQANYRKTLKKRFQANQKRLIATQRKLQL